MLRHLLVLSLTASAASAGVSFTSQARTVTAGGGLSTDATEESAPDFGTFHGDVSITVPNPSGEPASTGRATQHSFLTDGVIHLDGYTGGFDGYSFAGAGSGYGQSSLEVRFTATGIATGWSLYGLLDHYDGPFSNPFIEFKRLSGTPEVLFATDYFGARSFAASGELPDGEYQFTVILMDGWFGTGSGTLESMYDITLAVPGPGGLAAVSVAGLFAVRRSRR